MIHVTTRNNSFFIQNNLSVKEGDELTIEAILPNGDKISSETIVPKYSLFCI